MAKSKVKVEDKGWDRIRSLAAKGGLGGKAASVGIQGDAAMGDHDGMTNAELGAIHEFGTTDGRIPPRSFIGSTFDANVKKYEDELARIAGAGLEGAKIEGELLVLGEEFRADIYAAVKSGIPPPLAESTVERRGGDSTPLWDTGRLMDSISAVVVDAAKAKGGG
jgi:hypothetical protein